MSDSFKLFLSVVVFYMLNYSTCYAQTKNNLFAGKFEELGFSIQFMDVLNTKEDALIFTGRLAHGSYDTHRAIYGYKSEKYPAYIQKGFKGKPCTIVHKVSSQGDSLWTYLYPNSLEGTAIAGTPDGGFVLVGFMPVQRDKNYENDNTQAVTVMKLTKNGQLTWSKTISTTYNATSNDVLVLADGSILILSEHKYPPISSAELNPSAIRLVKLTQKGEQIWDKTLPIQNFEASYCIGKQMIMNKEGNIFLLGTMNLKEHSAYVAQLDTAGNLVNSKTFSWQRSKFSDENNWGNSMTLVPNGLVFSASAQKGHRIVRLNKALEIVWEKHQPCDSYKQSRIASNEKGEVYFVGLSKDNQLITAKYSIKGDLLWQKEKEQPHLFETSRVQLTKKGNILITGSAHTRGQKDWKGLYFKLDAKGNP